MVDFFAAGIGLVPASIPPAAKANLWLAGLPLPPLSALWRGRSYVLFCAEASTPLRSLHSTLTAAMVEAVWRRYRLPVLGFRPVDHPAFGDVSAFSKRLDDYIARARPASVVVSTETSAVHPAAGFDVPTPAVFAGIEPALRDRDYPLCHAVDIGRSCTRGFHADDAPASMKALLAVWTEAIGADRWTWPEAPFEPCHAATRVEVEVAVEVAVAVD